jgi:hypothetical protein
MNTITFYTGLDLGQARDYTAIIILEKLRDRDKSLNGKPLASYACRHIERLPLGTRYPEIVTYTGQLINSEQMAGNSCLTIDATGVGRPVCDMFAAAGLEYTGVTITGGDSESRAEGLYRVPKRKLVSALQVLLQEGRLEFNPSMPFADILTAELQNFKVKITEASNDTYGSGREGEHDDLVLAMAVAAWKAERPDPPPQVPSTIVKRRYYN